MKKSYKNAHVVESDVYEGFDYVIIKRDLHSPLYDLYSLSYYCGYVRIPDGFEELMVPADMLDFTIFCHGGITYSGYMDDHPGYWLGFDCSHYGDTIDICHLEYVANECKNIIDQIMDLKKMYQEVWQ